MRRCCGRFWRKCKPSRFAVSENQPYGRRPVGSPRDGLCPGIGSWGRNLAHECRWEVKCPCASPDFGIRHRIRVGRRALEFIWIRKPLNCVKPTDYRVGVEKWGLEVSHYGKLFDEADVKGICDVLRGTKNERLDQIGTFGIGFKSVYAFTRSPEIHSGDEHFVIRNFIRPHAVDPRPLQDPLQTLFYFGDYIH